MIANLKVGKTTKALANLTTPLTPQNPFAPWGVSPQAERLLFLLSPRLYLHHIAGLLFAIYSRYDVVHYRLVML